MAEKIEVVKITILANSFWVDCVVVAKIKLMINRDVNNVKSWTKMRSSLL